MKQKERAKAEVSKIRDKPIKGEAIYTQKKKKKQTNTLYAIFCVWLGLQRAKEKRESKVVSCFTKYFNVCPFFKNI